MSEKKNPPLLSLGIASTLGTWYDLCKATFGEESAPTLFIKKKLDEQGKDEPVIADEGQLLRVLWNMYANEENSKGLL